MFKKITFTGFSQLSSESEFLCSSDGRVHEVDHSRFWKGVWNGSFLLPPFILNMLVRATLFGAYADARLTIHGRDQRSPHFHSVPCSTFFTCCDSQAQTQTLNQLVKAAASCIVLDNNHRQPSFTGRLVLRIAT